MRKVTRRLPPTCQRWQLNKVIHTCILPWSSDNELYICSCISKVKSQFILSVISLEFQILKKKYWILYTALNKPSLIFALIDLRLICRVLNLPSGRRAKFFLYTVFLRYKPCRAHSGSMSYWVCLHCFNCRGWQIPTPWASAFIGRTSAFIVHNFIMDRWKSKSGKSHENLFVSPWIVNKHLLCYLR